MKKKLGMGGKITMIVATGWWKFMCGIWGSKIAFDVGYHMPALSGIVVLGSMTVLWLFVIAIAWTMGRKSDDE